MILAIILVILSIFATNCDAGQSYYVGGVRLNNGLLHGITGMVIPLSETVYQYNSADIAGNEGAITSQIFVRLYTLNNFHLSFLVGPNLEYVELNPTTSEKIAYLTAASGLIIDAKTTDESGLWLSVNYLFTDSKIKRWKVGAGIFSSLPF